ncbi:MAG: tRNA (N6-threonylcarbamoyladenosine(37)-N6)-methyltransferase TrmO [Kangiellaceae bacterium]|jgi:tRNA-Thr(GGU) m(6)t(6)A37 methyltransferase TsaA|nr:tRNA (N6-threonylcarbamoyladenosine(37)-N6)-methyltransferase TrmO [Kangiellaceae bacterium]
MKDLHSKHTIEPVAIIASPYKEKFGTPRQPGLVPSTQFTIELLPPYNHPEALRGLENYSHIWLIFQFHQTQQQGWKPTVRPPRLGGNKRLGVFATRSSFRPNNMGLSVAKIERLTNDGHIIVSGLDVVDSTPVFDIKPYIPYSDAIGNATSSFAATAPTSRLTVNWHKIEENQTAKGLAQSLKHTIEDILKLDPRPAYKQDMADEKVYKMDFQEWTISWSVEDDIVYVLQIANRPSRKDSAD